MYTEFEHKAIDQERRRDGTRITAPVRKRKRVTRRVAYGIAGALERFGEWALTEAERIRGDDPAQETYTGVGVSPIR